MATPNRQSGSHA